MLRPGPRRNADHPSRNHIHHVLALRNPGPLRASVRPHKESQLAILGRYFRVRRLLGTCCIASEFDTSHIWRSASFPWRALSAEIAPSLPPRNPNECHRCPDERRSEEHTSELQSHVNLVCRL